MYIIVIDGEEDRGAYSVADENGENVLYIWENEDDVERFVMMLEESGSPKMRSVASCIKYIYFHNSKKKPLQRKGNNA